MDFLADVVNHAMQENGQNEGDYINENGLLICGKCHTPKETFIPAFNKNMPTPCDCKKSEEQDFKQKQRALRIESLRRDCFQGSKKAGWTFEKDDEKNAKLSTAAHKYADHFADYKKEGKGLILYGDVGTGKSFMAACICNALIDEGYSCLFTSFAKLQKRIRNEDNEYLDRLNRVSLLVIDDLGAERDTDYMQEIVHDIIDGRCNAGKPVIVTTNWTGEDFKNPSDIRKKRVISRLCGVCCPVEVKGDDRRKMKLYENYGKMRQQLGLSD